MADLQELAGLLHVHKALNEHGERAFPNLKKHVADMLAQIEAEHAPQPEEPEAEEEE